MQTRKGRWQEDLFVASPLSALVAEDHILKRVEGILDLGWLHEAVRDVYCQDNGRPSVDPEAALRLMLAGFFYNIKHDRALMREAQSNVAIRWFAGYRLDEELPDRSSLTRIRQRWGAELFRRVFVRTIGQCAQAGLISAETVHIDATLIRADVSWDSLTTRHVDEVIEVNRETGEDEGGDEGSKPPRGRAAKGRKAKPKKYSPTDPDATMTTSCKQYHLEPSYKQHTAVDDKSGVIVDIAVTTGETSEGKELLAQIERVEANTCMEVKAVTCDGSYAHGANYQALEERNIDAVIPPQRTPIARSGEQRIPARRFKYDPQNDRVTCPAGRFLHRRGRTPNNNGSHFRAKATDCKTCPLRARCVAANQSSRTITIFDSYPALLRARRRKEKGWDEQTQARYSRHRWHVEGVHGRAKTQHGLARATRRGIPNVQIQAYLTAIAMNLKKLAAQAWQNSGVSHFYALLHHLKRLTHRATKFPSAAEPCTCPTLPASLAAA